MKIIAGLGNPARKYEGTRHNAGFAVIDELAEQYHIRVEEKRFQALVGAGFIEGERVLLVKPQTYMNLSGESLGPLLRYYKLDPSELFVIVDDINLELGDLRARASGSAGGHNGLKSVIANLGTDAFPRLRLGVGGKPERMELADYVLGHFSAEERAEAEAQRRLAAEAAAVFVRDGIGETMNRYNGRKRKEKNGGGV